MHKPLITAALAAAVGLAVPAVVAAAEPARPQFLQGSMNVYRRFPAEHTARMVDFYSKALGLRALQPINLTSTQQVLLFGIGSGQIKLAAGLKEGRQYNPGSVKDATGIRLYALHFPNEAELVARFRQHGFDAPQFRDAGAGRRAALVKDPAGFLIQLVVAPSGPASLYNGVEVGIAVSDLERSKVFYRDFAGLQELPPVQDAFLGVTKHPFRNGETTINLWEVGPGKPADTGSAGIQYVVANVDAVDAEAQRRRITVEEPLGGVPGFTVKTVWLNDPDGATNYFYQFTGPPRNQQAAAR